ncbi:Nuclease-related domain-containing protein [Salimicrobium halophilum]|uniref:Nuclease-related domain-containing protein n=1 Tax=Salimicrobium halophilum TaxID=86666 RepID=A0A1G8T582_9BACI|nr:Nuclease-related domain-containing protein [Salimicrobium halophilum]
MFLLKKDRHPPLLLKVLEALEKRKSLTTYEADTKRRLLKGWQGEKLFDSMTENIPGHQFILNDVRLNHRGTTFQIDTLLIRATEIHMYEVKYYDGDYFYENGDFKLSSGSPILNPLHQLERAKTLLTQFLEYHNFSLSVHAYLVFPHPQFFLYQAPPIREFIFLSQWDQHVRNLGSSIPLPRYADALADLLSSLHKKDQPNSDFPSYHYDDFQKGLLCPGCHSPVHSETKVCTCDKCGSTSSISSLVLQAAEELEALFPADPLTTGRVYDWCERTVSKERIQRVLAGNFEQKGRYRGTYYV